MMMAPAKGGELLGLNITVAACAAPARDMAMAITARVLSSFLSLLLLSKARERLSGKAGRSVAFISMGTEQRVRSWICLSITKPLPLSMENALCFDSSNSCRLFEPLQLTEK